MKTSSALFIVVIGLIWCSVHSHRSIRDACATPEGFVGTCTKARSCPSRNYMFSKNCRRTRVCCVHQMGRHPQRPPPPMVHGHHHGHFKPPPPPPPHTFNPEFGGQPHHPGYFIDENERRYNKRHISTTTTTTTTTIEPYIADRATLDQRIPNLRVRGCGIKKIGMTDFIVGGTESEYWPWMASIFFRSGDAPTSRFQCGGTVISRRYILTAAHCLQDRGMTIPSNRLTVRMGGPTRNGDGQLYRVANVTIHGGYRSNVRYNDIAVISLADDIESKNVVPACLPTPGMYDANFFQRNATVLGWGRTSEGGSFSENLLEANVPVVARIRCDARYRRLNSLSLPRGIEESQLCAGTDDGTRDACQGDSGGPLILEDRSQRWNVVGIVSFGYGCAHPDYPGVYTRVARYLPWLRDNTDIPARYIT